MSSRGKESSYYELVTVEFKFREENDKKQRKSRSRSRTGTRTRKRREKGQPKKSSTAWIYYMKDNRKDFTKRYPDMLMTDLTKKIAKQYKKDKNDHDIMKKYHKMADKDKERYEKEMKKWNAEKKKRSRSKSKSRSRSRSRSKSS